MDKGLRRPLSCADKRGHGVAPPLAPTVQSQDMVYRLSRDILYSFGSVIDCEVDFAQQGGAEEDHQSLFEGYDLDVFAAEGFADAPLSSLQIELSLAIDFEQPRSLRVLPARRVELIAARAGLPASGGGLHGESLVGANVVMLLAKGIQPRL